MRCLWARAAARIRPAVGANWVDRRYEQQLQQRRGGKFRKGGPDEPCGRPPIRRQCHHLHPAWLGPGDAFFRLAARFAGHTAVVTDVDSPGNKSTSPCRLRHLVRTRRTPPRRGDRAGDDHTRESDWGVVPWWDPPWQPRRRPGRSRDGSQSSWVRIAGGEKRERGKCHVARWGGGDGVRSWCRIKK